MFVGEDTEKISELLHGDIETKLPNATVMKHLIHQPREHSYVCTKLYKIVRGGT